MVPLIRPAIAEDQKKLFHLYRKVARQGYGIARSEKEISASYIKYFMKKSSENGFELVVEHPQDPDRIIGDIHCWGSDLAICRHVLADLTTAIDPEFQGQGIGKALKTELLQLIQEKRPDILRLESIVFENNTKSIKLNEKLGFIMEAKLENRVILNNNQFMNDILMVWLNPAYDKKFSAPKE